VIRWVQTATSGPAAISPLSSLRNDRTVALTAMGTVGLVATVSIVVFSDTLRALSPVIASGLTIRWYHGLMFGSSLGLVVASIYTAWPTFFVYHLALAASRRMPWRLGSYFEALHRHGILRQEGALYQFHQESMQDFLDESWHRSPDHPVPCPRPRTLPAPEGRRHRLAPEF
jgi:hypothetical protein